MSEVFSERFSAGSGVSLVQSEILKGKLVNLGIGNDVKSDNEDNGLYDPLGRMGACSWGR